MLRKLSLLFIFAVLSIPVFTQQYERYRTLKDTAIFSQNLGFAKKISVTVPIEWQKETKKDFPLIVVFDRQNKRSLNYIVNTIDYLTSTEQIPSAVIISVESEQRYRYRETLHKISDSAGLAAQNEKFIFDELVPLAEKSYHASHFRILIGHSRYGYFTTALFHSRINDLSAVISMSPFFSQKNIDLTDSIARLDKRSFPSRKYYRYGIGNDYPDDFAKMDSVFGARIPNPSLDMKGYRFRAADHSTTPGLIIGTALYEVFEEWSSIQAKYSSISQKDLGIKKNLEQQIRSVYGANLNFSLGILNGKGWSFYNEKQYEKAIQAWEILMEAYPNFSEGYLYILRAQVQLKQDSAKTVSAFKTSLAGSGFYSGEEKKELEAELKEILR